jgi:cytochrome c-type protein NapC
MRFQFIKDFLQRRWGIWVMMAAFFVGIGTLGASTIALRWTNTEEFCISCHEMRNNVYAEYKDTIHDSNRTGVRATCPDCHVPKTLGPLLVRKVKATFELWGKLTGKINTKEKFEKHRYTMALRVWTEMKENDSLECQNCHHIDNMNKKKQSEKAQARHTKAKAEKITCIECHFAIAHKEPEGELGPKDIVIKK